MLKYLLTVSIFCLSMFGFFPHALACDPLGCMLIGKQDLLILGEVTAVNKNIVDIRINFIFPQSRLLSSVQSGQSIQTHTDPSIINAGGANMAETVSIGKKYFLSLTKKDEAYVSAWGVYEVAGNEYQDVKLVSNKFPDDVAIQVFINSGGTKTDFYFINNKIYLKEGNNDRLLNPSNQKNISLILGGLLGVALLGGLTVWRILAKKKTITLQ